MASVEDLIATMNSGVHVGKQGYDLSALQAQLAKTLAYNPHAAVNHTYAPYQPISGTAHNPPAPVSSLNSVASTSFNGYQPASNITQQRSSGRPMPTPQVSFSGFDAPMFSTSPRNPVGPSSSASRRVNDMSIDEEGDMDVEIEDMRGTGGDGGWVATGFQPHHFPEQQIPQQRQQQQYDTTSYDMSTSVDLGETGRISPRSRSRPRAAAVMSFSNQDGGMMGISTSSDSDDFSAFATDAFAPVVLQDMQHSSSLDSKKGGNYNRPSYEGVSSSGGEIGAGTDAQEGVKDGWEAFRRCTKPGAMSAFAITPTNRTAPGSPTIEPRNHDYQQSGDGTSSPWSGRLRPRCTPGSGHGPD